MHLKLMQPTAKLTQESACLQWKRYLDKGKGLEYNRSVVCCVAPRNKNDILMQGALLRDVNVLLFFIKDELDGNI